MADQDGMKRIRSLNEINSHIIYEHAQLGYYYNVGYFLTFEPEFRNSEGNLQMRFEWFMKRF